MKKNIFRLIAAAVFCTIAIISLTTLTKSRPQYSILQTYGTKCTNCHYNVQGGGSRTEQGFLARKDMSVIKPSWLGISSFYDKVTTTNSLFDDFIEFGLDFRYQSAKFIKKSTGKSDRKNFPMQISPFLTIKPLKWLEFEGFYNIAYAVASIYPSQQPGSASMIIKPSGNLPSLRVGFFQPPIGTKYDDHTMLVRKLRIGDSPLFPDDYAELGAQLDYTTQKWLDLSVGAFNSKNLTSLSVPNAKDAPVPVVDTGSISAAGRAFITPDVGKGVALFFGGTYFVNKDFYIANAFINIGLNDKIALMTEYNRTEKKDLLTTLNFLAELTYQLDEAFLPFVRIERGVYRDHVSGSSAVPNPISKETPYYLNQYVIGAHVNLLPFIDVLPEYRILHWEHFSGYHSQWSVQLHVFY